LVISIPSGAIKSLNSLKEIDFVIPFQFLLVRLKVNISKLFCIFAVISIPSGAIKSNNNRTTIKTKH